MTHLYLMSHVFTIFLALCVFSPTCPVESVDADLSDVLSNYDVLHQSQISHIIVKRGTKGKGDHVKELKFSGLGRHFTLSLKPTVGLLSPQFKAYVVDGYGNKEAVPVDPEIFFSGVVTGEKTSSVQAYVDDDNLLTATIATPDDTYHIEPMWQYAPEGGNDSMVMYKGSDVKRIQKHHSHDSFCGYVTPPPGVIVDNKIDDEEHKKSKKGKNQGFSKENDIADKHSRVKRQQQSSHSDGRTRCSLFLVADYKFFSEMGQGNRLNTINYLIGLIHVVNEIYLSTTWEKNITNMAFVVRDILVHKEAQKNLAVGDEHYNMDKSGWDVKNLLTAFSRGNYRSYCLAHLFTHQKFAGGVLGLAYVGSPRQHTVGGICTPEYYSDGVLWLNTGLSSSLNYANRKVVKKEANIVTAHELGHNWGSEHDPDTDECANPDGGSYIMYTYSVSGYYNNNDNFSPCSKRSVGMVLQAKASKCFTEPTTAFCGNFLVEEGEECDAGLIESGEEDPCCTHNCELKSECSDKNSPCCDGCSFANKGFECRKASQLDALCEKDAECTGTSAECPKGSPVENVKNVSCLDSGTCIDGICVPYCEVREMFSCVCDGGDGCKRCCRSATRNCTKYTNQDNPFGIQLDEGQPCHLGICSDEGICEKTQQDAVQRFWNIIEDIDINYILEFIHDNIVGTVIILSLIVWIPASCIVNYVDNKRREKEEEEMTWRKPDNTNLIRDYDASRIRNFGTRTVRSMRGNNSAQPSAAPPFTNIVEPSVDY
ncbi:PREDICTED: ADAM 17-like protease [Priapulus caudatus]|uniref:ADAM 17-like protease n=1 Tax=Priapulus caudatus TaxID=37621 RepID=A0ABM1E7G7_PRICU|nr:PREDICTED: ADAM 17-like protease [Priapulus caudatus]